jgi:hypothetical protein
VLVILCVCHVITWNHEISAVLSQVLDGNLYIERDLENICEKEEGLAGGLASPCCNSLGLVSLESMSFVFVAMLNKGHLTYILTGKSTLIYILLYQT